MEATENRSMSTQQSLQVMKTWFDNLARGDMDAVVDQLADDIVFELPRYDHNRIIPYLGTMHGPNCWRSIGVSKR